MLRAAYSKPKLVLYTVGSVAFVCIGLWILRDPNPSGKALFSAWIGIVFFGPGSILFARRLFHQGEVLRIDSAGVFDSRTMNQPVPWAAVRSITERRVKRQVFFNLQLTRPAEEFVVSRVTRAFLPLNRFLGSERDTITLAANALTVSSDELRAALATYHRIGD